MPRPLFTVCYNIVTEGSRWIGTGKEFFDDEAQATLRHKSIPADVPWTEYQGPVCATKRPYHHGQDARFLGGAHVFEIEEP